MKETKAVLNARRLDAEAVFSREQKITLEAEIRRIRKKRMHALHLLIEKLTNDVKSFFFHCFSYHLWDWYCNQQSLIIWS